ncbi:MAG TPA: hypothetical protein VHX65_16000 [Pirellulales bacterium]|jgi:hypothetical protein|nr:hypothetical protein [Pirellulales bacterium]
MNTIKNSLKRLPWKALCGACAIWATAGLAAHAAPPGRGGHGTHGGINRGINRGISNNRFGGPYGGYGYNGVGTGWGVGVGGVLGVDLNGDENQIPYFAAHPPVYYSYPIARPYGDSPFPYPPGLFIPAASEGGPQTIVNPFAQPGSAAPSNSTPTPPAPSKASPATPAPSSVKPTAGRTASLTAEASRSVESLPSPDLVPVPEAGLRATSPLHVVLNPFVK